MKRLGALDGFREAGEREGRFLVLSNIALPEFAGSDEYGEGDEETTTTTGRLGSGQYALVDLTTGDLRTVSFDLGTHQQNVQPRPSPDGKQLAVHHANETGEPRTSIVSFDGGKPADLPACGFSGWSPSGSAFLAARFKESDKTIRHFIVEDGREREIATGARHVVWTAR